MFKDILKFESNKERDDFLIAILVVLFFGGLLFWLSPEFIGNDKPLAENVIENAIVPAIIATDMDTDGDGVMDKDDECITLAGIAPTGCPADSDGDGIYDIEDKCPELAGDDGNGGCPLDSDGDGIYNTEDECPKLAGTLENNGCPADTDGDGVYDTEDKCPELAGIASNSGCPEIKMEEEERALLEKAIQSVEFETGSANLKRVSRAILFRIVKLMNKYPDYKLSIKGHTDNTGDKDKNVELSRNRAKSCLDYFVANGIDASRVSYRGYGQSQPIDTNETEEGRERNRRVEFELHY